MNLQYLILGKYLWNKWINWVSISLGSLLHLRNWFRITEDAKSVLFLPVPLAFCIYKTVLLLLMMTLARIQQVLYWSRKIPLTNQEIQEPIWREILKPPSLRADATRGPDETQIEFHSLISIPSNSRSRKEKQRVGEKKGERDINEEDEARRWHGDDKQVTVIEGFLANLEQWSTGRDWLWSPWSASSGTPASHGSFSLSRNDCFASNFA